MIHPAGLGGKPADRPAVDGRGEGVLDRILGDPDVAEGTDQDSHRPTVLLTEHTRDLRLADCGPQSRASS
jgi:hypothetical protein